MMLTKRNYFIMAIIMGITLLLFQFSQWIRDNGNDYTINTYSEIKIPANNAFVQNIAEVGDNVKFEEWDYILFLGKTNTNIGSIVKQWTEYSKRDLLLCSSISSFNIERYGNPGFVLVDSQFVDFKKDIKTLKEFTENGVSIVFLNLPGPDVIENDKELATLMGISYVKEKPGPYAGNAMVHYPGRYQDIHSRHNG